MTKVIDVEIGMQKGSASAMAIDGKRGVLYIFGGWPEGADLPVDELFSVDLGGESLTWKRLAKIDPWPAARNGAAMVYDSKGDCLLLYAGDGGPGALSFTPLDDLWRYDLPSSTWRNVKTRGTTPPARWHTMMAVDEASRRAYILGGAGLGRRGHDRDLYSLDLESFEWKRVEIRGESPPSMQGGTLTFDVQNGVLVLCGGLRHEGRGEATMSSIWIFDPSESRWILKSGGEFAKRRDHVGVYDPSTGCHYVVGGHVTNTVGNWYEFHNPVRSVARIRVSTGDK